MNNKYMRILSLALVVVLVLGVFGGCVGQESIAPAENTYKGDYSLTTYEQSPDMKVDGILDEEAWQGKKWYENTYANTDGTLPTIRATVVITEQGVYVGSEVKDKNLTTDGERYPNVNSNWEIYLAACNADESLYSAANNGSWNTHRIYVDMRGDSMSLYTNTERAVQIDGELNSNNTNGATMELFVSWDILGVDVSKGIPQIIGMLPSYRGVLIPGTATATMFPAGANLNSPAAYHMFDNNGYLNADAENTVLGNAANGYSKSGNWDMSLVEENTVRSINGGHGYLFFANECGENFIVEATLVPVTAVNDDWPKAGICFQQTDGLYFNVMLDPNGKNGMVDSINGTKNFPNYQITVLDQHDGRWNQKSLSGYDKVNPNATTQEGVKLTVVKYGNQFWYFADGRYLTTQVMPWMSGDCFPGLYTLGYEVIFKDYFCKEIDGQGLRDYLNTSDIYTVNVDVDGKGGSAEANITTITGSGDVELTIGTSSGYKLSSVLINGQEKIDDVRVNAVDGVYTVAGVQGNLDVVVTFEKIEGVTYSGLVTLNGKGVAAEVVLVNTADGSAYYTDNSSAKRGFDIEVAAGTYEVRVRVDDGTWQTKTVTITEDLEEEIAYQVSE